MQRDKLWVDDHRRELVGAATALYTKLTGDANVCAFHVLATVRTWAFQSLEPVDHLAVVDDDSELSLARDEPHESFVELEGGPSAY